ncbi:uncharacterized protein V6R79_005083 [Siganus canaliculatus]
MLTLKLRIEWISSLCEDRYQPDLCLTSGELVALFMVVVVTAASAAVLLFCRGRSRKEPGVLQDEITSFTSDIRILTRKEGEDFTYECSLFFNGGRRLFCKNTCEGKNILINTESDSDQRGRYTIRYEEAEDSFRYSSLYVNITNLTMSDSGRYRCSSVSDLLPDSSEDFELRVVEVPELHTPPGRYSASPPPRTMTQGLTRPSSGTTETTEKSEREQRPAGSVVALFVRPAVVVVVIVASAAVLLFCWRRSRKPGD